MEYIWDGRGTVGPSAECVITEELVSLKPMKIFRFVLGWPEIVLPREQIFAAEKLVSSTYRFRSRDRILDGACFQPIGNKNEFRAALQRARIPIVRLSWKRKLKLELRLSWNQMRWGGRRRRRDLKRKTSLARK